MEKAQTLEEAYKAVLALPESPYRRVFRQGVNFFSELRPGALREDVPGQDGLSLTQLEVSPAGVWRRKRPKSGTSWPTA